MCGYKEQYTGADGDASQSQCDQHRRTHTLLTFMLGLIDPDAINRSTIDQPRAGPSFEKVFPFIAHDVVVPRGMQEL